MSKKIIAVAGATGAQGGGLVRAILEDEAGEFAVRALTRNTDSEKAKELASLGAEVVAADFDSAADLEKAFEGAYGAYLVTNFPADVYRSFGFPGADDLGNMFQYKAEFETEYCASRDLGVSRALNPELQTFAEWLAANKDRIPLS